MPLNQDRTSVIAVGFGICNQFLFDQGFHACFGAEDAFQTGAFICEQVLFVADFHLFQLCQVTQLQIQNGLCLGPGQTESLHQDRLGFVFVANDIDDLINIQVSDQQAFEDVHPVNDLVQAVLQATGNRIHAENQPLFEQ